MTKTELQELMISAEAMENIAQTLWDEAAAIRALCIHAMERKARLQLIGPTPPPAPANAVAVQAAAAPACAPAPSGHGYGPAPAPLAQLLRRLRNS